MRRLLGLSLLATIAAATLLALSAAPALGNHIHCGDTITQDTTLDSDLIDCPGDGIVIGAEGIALDLNGHTVARDASASSDVGISNRAGHDGVTMENGSVQGFEYAVQLGGCDGGICIGARRNRVHGLALSGGIFVGGSEDNEIEQKNEIAQNMMSRFGVITLSYSNGNLIKRNSASVYLFLSDGNKIAGNRDGGIRFYSSNHNRVERSTGSIILEAGNSNWIQKNHIANTYLGIAVVGGTANSNHVIGNHVLNSGYGGILFVGANNTIERNVVTGSAYDGFEIEGNSNRVERNLATRNGDDGFQIHSAGTTLTRNKANGNGDLGIEAVPGVTDGGGNRAFGNGNPLQCLNVACN